MPLNLCDDILNIISEYANMKVETKKYKSLRYSNKMKITKILYKCTVCKRMIPYHRYHKYCLQCKNKQQCYQVWLDNNRAQYFKCKFNV